MEGCCPCMCGRGSELLFKFLDLIVELSLGNQQMTTSLLLKAPHHLFLLQISLRLLALLTVKNLSKLKYGPTSATLLIHIPTISFVSLQMVNISSCSSEITCLYKYLCSGVLLGLDVTRWSMMINLASFVAFITILDIS